MHGKVLQRFVDVGQTVHAGDPLMRIDDNDLVLAIADKQQAVSAAKARVIQTSADEIRYRNLYPTGATSKESYEKAKADADSARAELAAAEALVQVARNQSNYAVLLADADGTVVETLAEPGQVVDAGQIVVRLAHAGPREAAVYLPEANRPALGSVAEANLYGADNVKGTARLRQLSDAADPKTRTYEARYVLEGDAAKAPLGATITIRIKSDVSGAPTEVPLGAIDDEGNGPGIWVIDTKTLKVGWRPVKIARFGEEIALLAEGATPGEQIVAIGGHYLHEGDQVRLVGEKAAMR
ncbi:MAG TPA: efflux RND transporter periplasmic adaptor subunit [Dongiaceae bacterium]|nr:efflux RND transporter periplasmic adaptor subunit [Dongiaceae bacterium]